MTIRGLHRAFPAERRVDLPGAGMMLRDEPRKVEVGELPAGDPHPAAASSHASRNTARVAFMVTR